MSWSKISERGGVGWLKCPYGDQLRSLELTRCAIPERIQAKLRERYPGIVMV
jgi:hypothetical protein